MRVSTSGLHGSVAKEAFFLIDRCRISPQSKHNNRPPRGRNYAVVGRPHEGEGAAAQGGGELSLCVCVFCVVNGQTVCVCLCTHTHTCLTMHFLLLRCCSLFSAPRSARVFFCESLLWPFFAPGLISGIAGEITSSLARSARPRPPQSWRPARSMSPTFCVYGKGRKEGSKGLSLISWGIPSGLFASSLVLSKSLSRRLSLSPFSGSS